MDIAEALKGFEGVWKRVEGKDKKPGITLKPKSRKHPAACRFIAGNDELSSSGGSNEYRAL